MKVITFILLLSCSYLNAQYVTTASNFYTNQELVENILFGETNCVENILVTNTVSGNFSNVKSFGFFESNNSGFPFESGLVLSTGRLDNVDGPNDDLSDDDSSNWNGDTDLENAVDLNPGETINASIIEFEFTPKAENLSFRYIFASEEYQEGNSNTCIYSDAFAFLIRPLGGQYENIALVPNTNTPVLVTSVHPEIPGACEAENETYFGQFNPTNAAINFNGRTAVLTATANVIPDQTYEIKLVIADEANYRYDSAVFIEANSFNIGADLGQDRTGDNALCQGEIFTLNLPPDQLGNTINWFYEANEITSNQNNLSLDISEANFGAGTYSVNVELPNGCSATDALEIEFISPDNYQNLSITQCQPDTGLAEFNLESILPEINSLNLVSNGFYTTENAAMTLEDPIQNTQNFETNQTTQIFIAVENQAGCQTTIRLDLLINPTTYPDLNLYNCLNEDDELVFFTNEINNNIRNFLNLNNLSNLSLHTNQVEAANNTNPITEAQLVLNETSTIYARVTNGYNCDGIISVFLNQTATPILEETETNVFLCLNESSSVELTTSILNDSNNFSYNWDTGADNSAINVSESGTYTVQISNTLSLSACSQTQVFNVVVSETAQVSYNLIGTPENFQVEIIAQGQGDYEFALNTSEFQDTPIFNVEEAQNTIFVQDKNGCGITSLDFQVIDFPEYFTPNNDGYNDVWRINGPVEQRNQIKEIQIFDRYGKHLSSLNQSKLEWNGNFNSKPLPNGDYWYRVEFSSGKIYTNHMTLKR